MAEKFYVTTAITYSSKKPHVGNTYEIVMTDAIARYKRMQGYDVYFLTGTDEHGQKIEQSANEAGISPAAYVDGVTGEIKTIWGLMNATYDQFIRTTDDYHERAVQKIFSRLYAQGDIYKSEYEGLYCVACESFYTPTQAEGGKCPDCGKDVAPTKEEAYFLKLSKYQDRLMKHIEDNPEFIQPESRKREMVNNFLKPGLQDLCVSRTSFKWGIPVEFDPGHVIYVWIDALSNYITALGYVPGEEYTEKYKKYWPADVHIIGKDILRFHTIYWPIMLMALGEPLPKQVLGHPWLLSGSDKMSKSVGNVIYADDLARHFGTDGTRYYLLSNMPYAQDGSITYENVIACYNTDLANTLGNLVNRTVAMQNKYFDGVICAPSAEEAIDGELAEACKKAVAEYTRLMDGYRLADAADAVMALARRCNKYIDETMPWALAKEEAGRARLGTVLYCLLESIRQLGVMLLPFIPDTAEEILNQIGTAREIRTSDSLKSFDATVAGGKVGVGKPLFARIDEAKKLAEIQAEIEQSQSQTTPKEAAQKDAAVEGVAQIGIEDFAKVALCCGEIKNCVPVPKSDKLLSLTIDDGSGLRQVVSGIAPWYSPGQLTGRKIALVSNLKPAKLRGVVSNGMILAADAGENDVRVLFLDSDVPNGAKIR